MWGLEYFRYYVYGKKVNLLPDHQALQRILKRNRAHKQYSARLTRWLDRQSLLDVNLQYTAGKKIPLTDYLKRQPMIYDAETETQCVQDEKEAEEEFVINQIYRPFEFNGVSGSIRQYSERSSPTDILNQSHINTQKGTPVRTERSIQTILPSISIKSAKRSAINPPLISTMDKVNG